MLNRLDAVLIVADKFRHRRYDFALKEVLDLNGNPLGRA